MPTTPTFVLALSPLGSDLISGKRGPADPVGTVTNCEADVTRLLQLAHGAYWKFAESAAAYDTDAAASFVVLRPGHCARLRDGGCAQILIPHIEPSGRSSSSTAAERRSRSNTEVRALVVLFDYARPGYLRGNHPEFSVPWLRRGRVAAVSLSSVSAREHIVPLFGRASIRSTDLTDYFLVNVTALPCFNGDQPRGAGTAPHWHTSPPVVRLVCRTVGCAGSLPKPVDPGLTATCEHCGVSVAWF